MAMNQAPIILLDTHIASAFHGDGARPHFKINLGNSLQKVGLIEGHGIQLKMTALSVLEFLGYQKPAQDAFDANCEKAIRESVGLNPPERLACVHSQFETFFRRHLPSWKYNWYFRQKKKRVGRSAYHVFRWIRTEYMSRQGYNRMIKMLSLDATMACQYEDERVYDHFLNYWTPAILTDPRLDFSLGRAIWMAFDAIPPSHRAKAREVRSEGTEEGRERAKRLQAQANELQQHMSEARLRPRKDHVDCEIAYFSLAGWWEGDQRIPAICLTSTKEEEKVAGRLVIMLDWLAKVVAFHRENHPTEPTPRLVPGHIGFVDLKTGKIEKYAAVADIIAPQPKDQERLAGLL